MNRREFVLTSTSALFALAPSSILHAQAQPTKPDLAALAERNGFTLVNRTVERLVDGTRVGVRLSAANGEGAALIPNSAFANGTIDIDLRGKNVPQQSFLGIVFHAIDGSASRGSSASPLREPPRSCAPKGWTSCQTR